MKNVKALKGVIVLNPNQLKHVKAGIAPDCEGGQIFSFNNSLCVDASLEISNTCDYGVY